MLKKIGMSFVSMLLVTQIAQAKVGRSISQAEMSCDSDPEVVASRIESKAYCDDAIAYVYNCGFGDARDLTLVSAATSVCQKSMRKLEENDRQKYLSLVHECVTRYRSEGGGMAKSLVAVCQLRVTGLFSELFSKQ